MVKVIMLIFMHLIGDSVLQNQKLRQQKIESVKYLFKHIAIYIAVFAVFSPVILQLSIVQTLLFCLVTAVLHFIEDYYFTKIKKHYWDRQDYKYVATFSIIEHGLHVLLLIVTFMIMFPGVINMSTWYHDFINHVIEN